MHISSCREEVKQPTYEKESSALPPYEKEAGVQKFGR